MLVSWFRAPSPLTETFAQPSFPRRRESRGAGGQLGLRRLGSPVLLCSESYAKVALRGEGDIDGHAHQSYATCSKFGMLVTPRAAGR